jgi:hypothetical protein
VCLDCHFMDLVIVRRDRFFDHPRNFKEEKERLLMSLQQLDAIKVVVNDGGHHGKV